MRNRVGMRATRNSDSTRPDASIFSRENRDARRSSERDRVAEKLMTIDFYSAPPPPPRNERKQTTLETDERAN